MVVIGIAAVLVAAAAAGAAFLSAKYARDAAVAAQDGVTAARDGVSVAQESVAASLAMSNRQLILDFMRLYGDPSMLNALAEVASIRDVDENWKSTLRGYDTKRKDPNQHLQVSDFYKSIRVIKNYFFQAATAYQSITNEDAKSSFARDVIAVWGIVIMFEFVQYAERLRNNHKEYLWDVLREALSTDAAVQRLGELGIPDEQLPEWEKLMGPAKS